MKNSKTSTDGSINPPYTTVLSVHPGDKNVNKYLTIFSFSLNNKERFPAKLTLGITKDKKINKTELVNRAVPWFSTTIVIAIDRHVKNTIYIITSKKIIIALSRKLINTLTNGCPIVIINKDMYITEVNNKIKVTNTVQPNSLPLIIVSRNNGFVIRVLKESLIFSEDMEIKPINMDKIAPYTLKSRKNTSNVIITI